MADHSPAANNRCLRSPVPLFVVRGIMLLDEPFEGLAVTVVQNLLEVCRGLAARGQTIVIVEQNVRAALSLARRAYVLDKGQIVFEGLAEQLRASPEIMDLYFGAQGRAS